LPAAKAPIGPHVLLGWQGALTQSPTPSGARQSLATVGQVLQGRPLTQSLFCAQLVAHTLPAQVYGEQLTGAGAAPQLPAPSHVWAGVADPAVHDPAAHTVPAAAFDVPQALLVQVLVWQTIVGAGQSLGARQATQVPLPSQTVPPLSLHLVPAVALVVLQHPPASHASITHAVVDAGQSVGLLQVTPPSQELEMPPVPVLELVAMPPLPVAVTPPVPLLELVAMALLPVTVTPPPAPPWPEVVEPSIRTVPSQPAVAAASAPVVRRNAALRFDVWFIRKPYRHGSIAQRIGRVAPPCRGSAGIGHGLSPLRHQTSCHA
jgi:hypothetical protein